MSGLIENNKQTSRAGPNPRGHAAVQSDSVPRSSASGGFFPNWFAVGLTVCFCATDLLIILHHEMWRDELQAWIIARQSGSLFDLLRNIRYEGHPILWFLTLFVVTRFTTWVTAMQLVNVLIATSTAYLIAAYFSFSRLEKVLLCFGYFPLYEFGVISRNYGLGLLFLIWFCALYRPDEKQNWVIPSLLLSLLANTSIYGTMIAVTFATVFFVFPYVTGRRSRSFVSAGKTHEWAAALIFMVSLAVAIAQMKPPVDTAESMLAWHLHPTISTVEQTLTAEWRAFLPIPGSLQQFWNTNFLDAKQRAMDLGSVIILLLTFALLVRKRLAFLAYASFTVGSLAFLQLKRQGFERHVGHLFLVFVACLWISSRLPDEPLASRLLNRASELLAVQSRKILTLLLCVQCAAGAIACWVDWSRPFSQAKAVAASLRANVTANMFLVGGGDAAESIGGYLDRPLYYVPNQSIGTFIIWNRNWHEHGRDAVDVATMLAKQRQQDVLLVSDIRLHSFPTQVHETADFGGSVVEDFYLYRVSPNP